MADHRTTAIPPGTEQDVPGDTTTASHPSDAVNATRESGALNQVLLRSVWGLPLLSIGSNVAGAAVVAALLVLSGAPHCFGSPLLTLVATLTGYIAVALIVGVAGVACLRYRSLAWLDHAQPPTEQQARHTLRLPIATSQIVGALWAIGIAIMSTAVFALLPAPDALGSIVLVCLGGLATVGYNYLFIERAIRPVTATALATNTTEEIHTSVMSRLILTWALSTALPLAAALVLLNYPGASSDDRIRAAIYLVAGSLGAGVVAETVLARAVAQPLRRMRTALEHFAGGHLDTRVPVDDSSEIGILQNTVNDMIRERTERDRLHDIFGRHVGKDVAARALARGSDFAGEIRNVTAVFVDVRDSTAMAYHTSPQVFVDKLNRLLADVIEATDRHGGLVNKLEGDAALCIFGAPGILKHDATAALQAAREICDRTMERGELDVGIGLAKGPVFAGNLGTDQRLEYTVIGDAVNEAARLTELAKDVPGKLLASDAVIADATPCERRAWHPYAEITVRGRATPTRTWARGEPNPTSAQGAKPTIHPQ